MKRIRRMRGAAVLSGCAAVGGPAWGQVPPDPAPARETPPGTVPARKPPGSLKFGMDYYYGYSNFTGGVKRFNDMAWAGLMTFAPSTASLTWNQGDRHTTRLAVGIGDTNNGRRGLMDRAAEAYFATRNAQGDVFTVGKFFTPFGTNEWQYETKYGVMAQAARGANSLSVALQYGGGSANRPNLYLRAGRQVGARTALGFSGGLGRGLSYGSTHDALLGLDAAHAFNGVTLTGEYALGLGPSGPFSFLTGRVAFTGMGRLQPYLALYTWKDASGGLGSFRSQLAGFAYQVTPFLTFDTGVANTPGRATLWFQTRTQF